MAGLQDYPKYFNQPAGKATYNFLIGVPEAEKARRNQQDMEIIRQSLPAARQDRGNQAMVRQSLPVRSPPQAAIPQPAAETKGELSYLGNSPARQDLRDRSQTAQQVSPLISQEYRSLNNPEINAPIANGSPGYDQNIFVKESLATPQEYTAAVQANQRATQFGQQAGLPQSQGARGYTSNDATKAGMEYGGAKTEYAIPGKGTATFMGQRQGGGSFSVGGRTPDEQAAIDASVKSIESQTSAMRGLRNAYRQEQGRPTVEQEQQTNAMQAFLGRMAPKPDMSGLQEQQAQLMSQLQSISQQKGLTAKQRDAAMHPYEMGLAQIAAQQQAAQQGYQSQLGAAQNMWQTNASQESAAAKNAADMQQWAAQYGLDVSKMDAEQQRGLADMMLKTYGVQQKDQELAIDAQRANNPRPEKITNLTKDYYTEMPGKPAVFNHEQFAKAYGIPGLPANPNPGEPYIHNGNVITVDQNGNPVPYNGGWNRAAMYYQRQ